jgi:hypothetical protein
MFGTQDLKDDDAKVIDDYLIETDRPPKPITEPIPILPDIEQPRETRLLSGTILLTSGSDPQLILNGDSHRKTFRIWPFWVNGGAGPGFNDYINLSDDLGAVSNAKINVSTSGIIRLRPVGAVGTSAYEFNDHTGPIYVSPGNALSGPIELTWNAVTY